MKFTVKKDPVRQGTVFLIEVGIDDFEAANVRLSEDEKALIDDADSGLLMSDRLLALARIVRKIEQTVMPRARKDPYEPETGGAAS